MTSLRLREAVQLGQVLVDRAASGAGIRVLAIKGPALTAQGLRGDHESADVDVLIDPRERTRFLTVMEGLNWAPGPVSTAPRILPQHSVTLRHPTWPIEVDAHHEFPGFFADPQVVFDVLWERRTTVRVGGADVVTCDPVGHTAIAALHHLRDPARGSSGPGLNQLEEGLKRSRGHTGAVELAEVAARTGAGSTLRPFLDQVGAPPGGTVVAEPPADWDLRTRSTGSLPSLVAITRAPLRQWPGIIRHAVMLTDEEIDALRANEPAHHSRTGVRLRRLARGVKQLPRALLVLVRARLRWGARR